MIYLIVGHRGVGKTHWLKKIEHIFINSGSLNREEKKIRFIDLDREIEKKTGKTINTLLSCNPDADSFRVGQSNTLTERKKKLQGKEESGAGQKKSDGKRQVVPHKNKESFFVKPYQTKTVDLISGKKNIYIFQQQALSKKERHFRLMENEICSHLIDKYKNTDQLVFIAVGAGFRNNFKIPSFCHIIHLIRETDPYGRVFSGRPRLKISESPYEEYMSLYDEREKFYRTIKEDSFVLPEQDFKFNEAEKLLFGLKKGQINTIITLNKNSLPAELDKWPSFIEKRLNWGVRFFELRDDQLKSNELNCLLKIIPKEKQLLSFRKSGPSFFSKKDLSSLVWDWALEKGVPPPPPSPPPVLSLHERKKEDMDQLCKKLSRYEAGYFKLAVPVYNLKELVQGHSWFLKDPEHRCFLPVSGKGKSGLWRWYRQIFGPQMKLHFVRESRDGVSDQPFLYEHLYSLSVGNTSIRLENSGSDRREKAEQLKSDQYNHQLSFAAVLGDPVVHSASPAFHRNFFAQQGMMFTRITLREEEFTKENLCALQKLGLVFAAVTSPLKKKAFQICDDTDSVAQLTQSVNTLLFKNKKWFGINTDIYGLQALLKQAGINKLVKNKAQWEKKERPSVMVWGGGGMKSLLEGELPFAKFYSARTGQQVINTSVVREHESHTGDRNSKKATVPFRKRAYKWQKKSSENSPSSFLIWAVGRSRMSSCVFPPLSWKPGLVVDLNYTENSPGLEYALMTGAGYLSGHTMFKCQAKKQQECFLKMIKKI